MEATVEDCRDAFKIGHEMYLTSREEANEVWELYHNTHYTDEQQAILDSRGQPKETFNVIKMFARMLVGYYSSVVNTAVVKPRHPRDTLTATVLNDTINYIIDSNRFDIIGDQIKLGGLISGLLCSYQEVLDSGHVDQFNRPIYEIKISHVPDYELILDPMSKQDDYSDARYLHRFKWMPEDEVIKLFGKGVLSKLEAYSNYLNTDESEFDYQFGAGTSHSKNNSNYSGYGYSGYYKVHDNYLITHTVLEDSDGKRWSIFWHDEVELLKTEITTKQARWPYRVQLLHSSNKVEYYGIFREVIESQKAIDQAIIQIQQSANTTKIMLEEGAVKNIEAFKTAINRVNGVIPILSRSKIHLEDMTTEIAQQYVIIDKALDRIQRVLGINDSFLGMAFASDSGRKVKLQKDATIMSLRYITARIESYYRSLAIDIANLAKQYYTANQFMLLTDAATGDRWVELNKPMTKFSGKLDGEGNPIMVPILMEVLDPANGEPVEDDEGNLILAPVNEEGTDISFSSFNIKVESTSYNDEDERGQVMLESVLSGMIGNMLAKVNPSGFFNMASLAIQTTKTRFSPEMSRILSETATSLAGNQEATQSASLMAQGGGSSPTTPKSKANKIPTNTNQGV